MSQSSYIAAALLIGFIVYVTLKQQLADYIGILTGPSQPGSSATVTTPANELQPGQLTGTCAKWNTDGTCATWNPPASTYSQDGSITTPLGSIGPAPTGGGVYPPCTNDLRVLGLC